MSKKTKESKKSDNLEKVLECADCAYWSEHLCVDSNDNPVKRDSPIGRQFWFYEVCKKNWGLPQNAYISATSCKFYKEKN